MSSSKKQKTGGKDADRKSRAAEVANTFEWLITAFILAFLFRAFVMEAFRIPTGSMADTLKGKHFRLRCYQCGYKYDYGLGNYGLARDTAPGRELERKSSRCPSCGHYQPTGGTMPIANGDRILVLKCIYQFVEPNQWDVVVFKNPLDPSENYIKRLVGRPGETVEIIDGDVYTNGLISRKPPKVQNELWMPVYDNDYRPVRPEEPVFNRQRWQQPFRNVGTSEWKTFETSPTEFHLDSAAEQINTMVYDASVANDFRATYAYDDVRGYANMPYCSDLMVRFYARLDEGASKREKGTRSEPRPRGRIGIGLSKYQTNYKAWVDSTGEMVIAKVSESGESILKREPNTQALTDRPTLVQFADVDHQLVFQVGSRIMTYDLGRGPDDGGPRRTEIQPQVEVFGSGKLRLSHLAIFRDIHYTAEKYANSNNFGRATEGKPFTLGKDEFFVLGDNSPNSEDSRWWDKPGIGNNDLSYRQGIVPRDYLVGKALFVYWPSGFEFSWPQRVKTFLFKNSRYNRLAAVAYWFVSWQWIPNIGQMRFIYGGSSKQQ